MSKKEDQIDDKSEDVVEESQEEQQNDSDLNNLTYEELLEKVESLKEDSLRSAAELENFKRRTSNELSNALKYANTELLVSLVPIITSLEKAIENSGLIPFKPDLDSYVAYLRHLAVPTSRTGNKNILKLEPGQYLVINKDKSISKNKYWDPFTFQVDYSITEKDAILKVEELLLESVEYRKVSDVEVGLFLSGGLDSSLIGKIMSSNTNSDVKSFNIDYEEHFSGYQGEVEQARHAASHIDIKLIEDKIQYSDFKQIIDNYSFYQDDLVGDEVGIPLYFLGKS